jgi:hypothetical protein
MNINATLLGEIMFVFVLFVGSLSYYLGRRKTLIKPRMLSVIFISIGE